MGILRRIRNPALFQGSLRRRGYFEGWYFKLISADRAWAAAVIPGVVLAGPGSPDSHAFVQFICGGQADYFRFPLSDFSTDSRRFHVSIGSNRFSADGLTLRMGGGSVAGELAFPDALPFPKTPLWPGIMGPYSYVPGMECYHGIVTIRHSIRGSLVIHGREVSFDGGSGYVEKDWGRAFPSAWVWVQASHFPEDSAFLFSVADIPWPGGSFRGFFCFLYTQGRLHRFATYTGAKLAHLSEIGGGAVEAALAGHGGTLEFTARPGPGGLLRAPKNGLMDRLVEESIAADVSVRLKDREGRVLFEGDSPCSGMERYRAEELM